MREIFQKELLKGMEAPNRKAVESLMEDCDVHYLVLLASTDGSSRKLISVEGVELDGMVSVAHVDCQNRVPRSGRFFESKSALRVRELEAVLHSTESERDALSLRTAALCSELLHQESQVAILHGQLNARDQLSKSAEDLEHPVELLDTREVELARMEEAMLSRMNQYMEKCAELEQWEEHLFHRERLLASKVSSC